MSTCDVVDFKTRSNAAYGALALDYVGNMLDSGCMGCSDAVTVIEFRSDAEVIIDREPVTNVLYNKLVHRHSAAVPASHGNYLPALELLRNVLERDKPNRDCAVLVLFLSDGRPSDACTTFSGQSVSDVISIIGQQVFLLSSSFGRRLTFGTIGFSGKEDNITEDCAGQGGFSALKIMAEQALVGGAQHGFFQSASVSAGSGLAGGLSAAVSSLVSHLSATRTHLTAVAMTRGSRIDRTVQREHFPRSTSLHSKDDISADGWAVHALDVKKWVWSPKKGKETRKRKLGATPDTGLLRDWTAVELSTSDANGVAMRTACFGEGAERLAFLFREVRTTSTGTSVPVGLPLVAKESRYDEGPELERILFHNVFAKTQNKAQSLATMFNERTAAVYKRMAIPAAAIAKIEFLECGVYSWLDERNVGHGVLVERRLDPAQFKKWNGNNGFVAGSRREPDSLAAVLAMAAETSAPNCRAWPADIIADMSFHPTLPGVGEDDGDSSDDEELVNEADVAAASGGGGCVLLPADFVHAFSHFTHRNSKRKMLVCDLQGQLDTSVSPPVFLLTDPVIHYKSSSGRTHVHGRTDRGEKGIADFFKTHACTPVCEALGLAKVMSRTS